MRSIQSLVFLCGFATIANAAPIEVQFGQSGDIPVPRDYDNDGDTDFAVWRPGDGNWFLRGRSPVQWGMSGDKPVPADYNNDGLIDYAVWRPGNGVWYVRDFATLAMSGVQWGIPTDIAVPGDYTGDGQADFAVYRPTNHTWYIRDSVTGAMFSTQWGMNGDIPVTGDFDGEPGDDYNVFRPSTGEWLTLGPRTLKSRTTYRWGGHGDIPLTANFGCSHKAGQTIFRNGEWWSWGQLVTYAGAPNDIPVPANYTDDFAADYAVWRPSNGTWYIWPNTQNQPRCNPQFDGAAALVDGLKDSVQGIVVAAVKNGEIKWTYGMGMANTWHPATPDIPWQLASISKLFIATAVLQLVDSGQIAIDQFSGLTNPHNFANPRLWTFATHTSGVRKDVCTKIGGIDPPTSLAMVMEECFFKYPQFLAHWDTRPPGFVTEYSNAGAAWPARVVEMVTGQDFAARTQQTIFARLGMTSTGWFPSALAGRPLAAAFEGPDFPVTTSAGVSPYVSGNLRSSARDLANFMIMATSDGSAFGQQILAPGRMTMATSPVAPNQSQWGFYWVPTWHPVLGKYLWGHNGSIPGICTQLDIDPATRTGVVVLTNGSCGIERIRTIQDFTFAALATIQ